MVAVITDDTPRLDDIDDSWVLLAATRMAAIGSARGSVIGSGGCDLVRGGRVLSNSTRYCFGEQGRETANRAALSHRYNSV